MEFPQIVRKISRFSPSILTIFIHFLDFFDISLLPRKTFWYKGWGAGVWGRGWSIWLTQKNYSRKDQP